MRLMDRGVLAGQCNLALLPKRDPNRLVSLEQFQQDVRKALGDNFGEFVAAGQSVDQNGHRVLRVVAEGSVAAKADGKSESNIPIRWIYYHVADREGRQAALTFTVEGEHVERFADADRPIVEFAAIRREVIGRRDVYGFVAMTCMVQLRFRDSGCRQQFSPGTRARARHKCRG